MGPPKRTIYAAKNKPSNLGAHDLMAATHFHEHGLRFPKMSFEGNVAFFNFTSNWGRFTGYVLGLEGHLEEVVSNPIFWPCLEDLKVSN